MSLSSTTKSLLALLEKKKVIRLKRKNIFSAKRVDKVFEELRQIAKENKNIRCLESSDPPEMIILYDINYKIDSFLY